MIEIGAFEAKTKFSELLNRVENGETIIVTRHGAPVARIEGIAATKNLASMIDKLGDFRRNIQKRCVDNPITREELASMIAEGRR